MAASNDFSGCSFAAVEFTTKTSGGGETPEPPVSEDVVVELSYQENGKEGTTKVNFKKFKDATDALNALVDCDNITLTLQKDTTIQPTKAYGYAAVIQKSCTLDLNGKVLTAYSDIVGAINGGLLVEGNIHFVLTDSSESRTGMILASAGPAAMISGLAIGSGFDDDVYERLPGEITFEMDHAVVKDANYDQPKAAKGCLTMNSACTSAVLNESAVYGSVTANCASLTLNDSRIESNTENQIVLSFRGKLAMNDSVVVNTYDGTGESFTVDYGGVDAREAETVLSLTNSTISAGSGTALNLGMRQGTKYTVDLQAGARVLSDGGVALHFDSKFVGPSWYDEENPTPHATVHLYAGSVVSGASAIEAAVDTQHYELSDVTKVIRVEMDDGAFLGYDDVPALPNSSVMTYPDGMVLDVNKSNKAGFEKYYTLKSTSEMDQVRDTIEFGYQYFATLNATIEGTQSLYTAGNADGTYDALLWSTFTEAYEAAVALRGSDEIAANLNANQNEIDYREQQLSAAALALRDSLEAADLSKLANGTYSIEIQMMHSRDDGSFSMANGAVGRTALLTIKDDEQTIAVDFKPMELGPINGHLLKFWVYNAPTPNAAKIFNASNIQDDYVVHSNYYNQDGVNDPVYVANGTYPGKVIFKLPYFQSTDGYNKIYGRVSVDAMASDQNVIMLLQYYTLKPISTTATLTVEPMEVSLLANGTQTVTASVLGGEGYTISYSSDKPAVATVNESGVITAVGGGSTTVKVTASKDGEEDLVKTVSVTVAAADADAVKVENASVTSGAETAEVTGDVLVTSGGDDSVEVSGTVTVNAKAETTAPVTASSVTIQESAADALAASNKTVIIQTGMGDVTLDAALMDQVAAKTGDVKLEIKTAQLPTGTTGSFEKVYELTLDGVSFGSGKATVTVPTTLTGGYAYCISDSGSKTERQPLTISDGKASWTTGHFSVWALSASEYTVSGNTGGNPGGVTPGFFLEDGNYYVDISLYKESSNEVSMGDVAFKNNRRALVTVSGGKITSVQIATNPVDVSGYHSGIITFKVTGASVRVNETGALTTSSPTQSSIKDYTYVKRVTFNMPSAGQPDAADAVTYLDVEFYVPDTPMDSVVDAANGLNARIRFDWSSASATGDSSLESDDSSARGSSSITGKEIEDVVLTDKDTGIRLNADTEGLSDEATLRVTKITSGSDYDKAAKAMKNEKNAWALYEIVTLVDGKVTAPEGSVTVSIPCTEKGLSVYRINDSGTRTTIKGKAENGYYVFSTSSLGLFAVVGELGEAPAVSASGFTDTVGHWAEESINFVVEKGLFSGTSKTTFSPNTAMTRGMFVTVLGRLAGVEVSGGETKFTDVKADAYYAPYVKWANENGIVGGTSDTTYSPDREITRQEMAVMLARYCEYAKIELKGDADAQFADGAEIADWAKAAVETVVKAGLLKGVGDDRFSPASDASRAQVATLLARFMKEYNL